MTRQPTIVGATAMTGSAVNNPAKGHAKRTRSMLAARSQPAYFAASTRHRPPDPPAAPAGKSVPLLGYHEPPTRRAPVADELQFSSLQPLDSTETVCENPATKSEGDSDEWV